MSLNLAVRVIFFFTALIFTMFFVRKGGFDYGREKGYSQGFAEGIEQIQKDAVRSGHAYWDVWSQNNPNPTFNWGQLPQKPSEDVWTEAELKATLHQHSNLLGDHEQRLQAVELDKNL